MTTLDLNTRVDMLEGCVRNMAGVLGMIFAAPRAGQTAAAAAGSTKAVGFKHMHELDSFVQESFQMRIYLPDFHKLIVTQIFKLDVTASKAARREAFKVRVLGVIAKQMPAQEKAGDSAVAKQAATAAVEAC